MHEEKYLITFEEKDGEFTATLPFRNIGAVGATREQAAGTLVRVYAELARKGSFNPATPGDRGAPPIQHVLSILGDMLDENIRQRNDHREFTYENDMKFDDEHGTTNTRPGRRADGAPTWGSAYAKSPMFQRDNEVISGLATAIAALARVKEL